ncbi:hypothetical protein EIKCOROL_01303 [Eikenella corrodens ATCC 23834]|uniref:Uncharacterized protein n=1 Tax=Eikenella corrodens ATCC 23834 TaxID=546274 RepID=C0DVB4_EIKCO|nr:hypothetical protein EIKCOROL_01303 [Eikenella corrodens ATCC 23834]
MCVALRRTSAACFGRVAADAFSKSLPAYLLSVIVQTSICRYNSRRSHLLFSGSLL